MTLLEELKAKKGNKSLLHELEEKKEKSLSGGEVLKQAVSNIPSSAAQLASDITMPFRHPVQTAQSLTSLGKGIYQLATPGEQPDEATAKAVGQFFQRHCCGAGGGRQFGLVQTTKQSLRQWAVQRGTCPIVITLV